ncbi:MAG TPA: hypothetical protein VF557_17010 [Jatrophihabitans sp.]|jgi:hypothetical protein|uniref:hypothetical protein n=1 Tax=Jatrophihabitans sp. TaxID=1932789 RepID=UPI002F003F61
MYTNSAQRARMLDGGRKVVTSAQLLRAGATRSQIIANIAACRWQRCGRAIVLHCGELTRDERWSAALANVGRGSVLSSFTALEYAGLTGWERPEIHVLAPAGTPSCALAELAIVTHRSARWPAPCLPGKRIQIVSDAAVRAAGSFRSPRPGCGVLAAVVQQRLADASDLGDAVRAAIRIRHRGVLLQAVADIAGGSQALSEIDFVQLCRRAGLPLPHQQQVRRDGSGRRRYLDASWRRVDGRLVVVEVDGAVHLSPRRWCDDQLRQNELTLSDALVLRFPSVIVRTEPGVVARQLRQALGA